MADLVPDDVFEHPLGRQQQPPVEAHAPARRARGPAGALRADVQGAVGAARQRGRAVEARGDLRAGGPPVEALDRRAGVAGGHQQPRAVAVHARAARLRDELERRAQIRDRARPRGDPREHLLGLLQPTLDPRAQLAHGGRRGALGRTGGQHDLDAAVGVHVHAHPPRAGGAPDGVGDLAACGSRSSAS